MTANDKAAVAAGLWEPNQKCQRGSISEWVASETRFRCKVCGYLHIDPSKAMTYEPHIVPVPDMHDPANLWRALENRQFDVGFRDGRWFCDGEIINKAFCVKEVNGDGATLAEAVFAALVALYDADHS